MPALPLNPEQLDSARRLKALFKAMQATRREAGEPATQEWASHKLGFNQSALNQYLNGKIPLNAGAASKFAELLKCEVSDFSPPIASAIHDMVKTAGSNLELFIASDRPTEISAGKGWPFARIDVEKVRRLNEDDISRLEGAMLLTAAQIGVDIKSVNSGNRKVA